MPGVTTVTKNNNFQMIEPCEAYLEHKEFEVLDGSYHESNGGYMIIRNTTSSRKTMKKGTYIGDGYQVELEDLPFMSLDRISALTEKSEEMIIQEESVKEKSRKKFLEKIKDYDPGLKRVLEKYQEMYLDPNPMEFETLNIKRPTITRKRGHTGSFATPTPKSVFEGRRRSDSCIFRSRIIIRISQASRKRVYIPTFSRFETRIH